jgi:hypothetical protein
LKAFLDSVKPGVVKNGHMGDVYSCPLISKGRAMYLIY